MDHYDLWEAFARKETILHGSIFLTQSFSLTFSLWVLMLEQTIQTVKKMMYKS